MPVPGIAPLTNRYSKQKNTRKSRVGVVYHLLNYEQGIGKRKKRCWDVEAVFGNIKQNHGFCRFMLKGKQKIEIEWGLLAIVQNLRKKAA